MNTRSLLLTAALLGASSHALAQDPPARPTGGAAPSDDAFEMGSPPGLADGLTEEDMWPAASAEGWRQPCLVPWQRSFDDAMRVAHADNKPLLVAVNMDGEIASEHFAGVRYRSVDTAAMMSRYACVIASVYRHTPRDYDEEGHRIECPRFGTVTCGEHIQAERELYDQYFDGKRISPRHIVLDLEGKETLDVYYSWDTATVFTTFRKGVEDWPEPEEHQERGLADLVKSADARDRQTIELAYTQGNRTTKRSLLLALIEAREVDQVELLRRAIFGFDLELAALARRALAQSETEGALDLMAEALKTPLEPEDRELLLAAVTRLGKDSKRARTLGALHSGLALGSRHIDEQAAAALAREYDANVPRRVDVQARAEQVEAQPRSPEALLELAEALTVQAQESAEPRYAKFLYQDARSAALEAERLGASGAHLDAVLALAAVELGDLATARTRAVAAVEGGLLSAAGSDDTLTPASTAQLLQLFAQVRMGAIRRAYRRGDEWPAEWMSDVNAAYATLAAGPLDDPAPLVSYHDFLRWIGATQRANAVLDQAMGRFPDAALLHERLRARLLWEAGPQGLERGYAERLQGADSDGTQLTWFAGYASIVAAEHYRRRGEFEAAPQAYGRAIEHYQRNIELHPAGRETCLHFIALSHAGRARVALEHGALNEAADALLTGLRLWPQAAASTDGLNITPLQTAKMLKARLLDAKDADGAAGIQAAMDALDPKLLEPPPSELQGSRRRGGR